MTDKLPTIEELIEMWSKDSEVDQLELDQEALKTAKLHGKYLKYYTLAAMKAKKLSIDYGVKRQFKWRYYNGWLTEEELKAAGLEQFQLKLIEQKINQYMEGDKELIDILAKKEYYEEVQSFCKEVLKSLSNRVWSIKSAIDFRKFMQGG